MHSHRWHVGMWLQTFNEYFCQDYEQSLQFPFCKYVLKSSFHHDGRLRLHEESLPASISLVPHSSASQLQWKARGKVEIRQQETSVKCILNTCTRPINCRCTCRQHDSLTVLIPSPLLLQVWHRIYIHIPDLDLTSAHSGMFFTNLYQSLHWPSVSLPLANSMYRSFQAGEAVQFPGSKSIASGLSPPYAGSLPLELGTFYSPISICTNYCESIISAD